MLRPSHVGDPWHVVFRFDSEAHLRDWEVSPDRATLLADGEHLVESTDMHRVNGLETWFSLPGRTAPAPPKWKMFLVSATVFYLLNVTLSLIYGWALDSWPLPLHLATLGITSQVAVAVTGTEITAGIQKCFSRGPAGMPLGCMNPNVPRSESSAHSSSFAG